MSESDSPIFDQVVSESQQMRAVVTPAPSPVIEAGDGYDPDIPPPSSVCGYDVDRTGDDWPGELAPVLAPSDKGT